MKCMKLCLAALAVVMGALWCAADVLPTAATWLGGGDRTDYTDSKNWECKDADGNELPNAIPDVGTTVVTVSGDTNFTCPTNATPIWKSITISGTVNLTADCDWRGLGSIFAVVVSGSTINLKGRELFAKMPNGNSDRRINITDDSPQGEGGRFHMDVAEGETFINSKGKDGVNTFWFSGTMELVKDGKGTYKPYYFKSKTYSQDPDSCSYTYTGGTTVHEGLLDMNNDPEGTKNETYYAQETRPVLGKFSATHKPFIRIDAGATIDYKGIYDIDNYQTYMNGGTIKNTRKPAHCEWKAFGDLTFEADSFFDIARTAQLGGYFYLNGHTLTVDIAPNQDWYCKDGSGTNGTVIIRGEGVFHSYNSAINAPTVNFDIATAISMDQPMTVSNYVARYVGEKNAGTQTMTVFGTFTPVTDCFYGCTLQNGSTLDLSTRTGVWNTQASFTGSGQATGKRVVCFADDATITVDLGDRTVRSRDKIIAWTDATKPPTSVKFRPVSGSNYSFVAEDDGLYVSKGLIIRLM